MSSQADGASLALAVRELEAAWADSGRAWSDDARHDFERHYFAPLLDALQDAAKGMALCHDVIHRVRQECGDHNGSS